MSMEHATMGCGPSWTGEGQTSFLLRLPNELLEHVFSNLATYEVAKLNIICRRFHTVISEDILWKKRFLNLDLSHPALSPFPFNTWKELYLAHYPYWFIPQRRVWFADGIERDGGMCGQLLLARYQPSTGTIEAYVLVGDRGDATEYAWPEQPSVNVHAFNPQIRLHLAHPVVRLRSNHDASSATYKNRQPVDNGPGLRSMKPAANDLNENHDVTAHIMLAKAIEPHLQHSSMRLWPPPRIPAIDRVRCRTNEGVFSRMNFGRQGFRSHASGISFDRPTAHTNVCQSAFRFQKQVGERMAAFRQMLLSGVADGPPDGTGFGGLASGVTTYSTLPEDAYRPTPERPYQGIWVGDYAAHGCEFLLIRQKVTKEEIESSERLGPYYRLGEIYANIEDMMASELHPHDSASALGGQPAGGTDRIPNRQPFDHRDWSGVGDQTGEKGRLEAIKLTGDPNVPRAEFTFVAEDIGKRGELYMAESDIFKDKRVVGCWGHIAGHGFTGDVFVQTDLILVSHDVLAQHWHGFGHVAFYRRVDIDKHFDSLCNGDTLQL